MQININTDAAVVFTNKLEKMHRSALPNAVRETLSRVALEVKKKTMPAQAKKSFVNRSPNFFKANSRVEFARGYNIAAMKSTVGFVQQNLKGENNFSVKDLEQQEHGGTIKGRSFVPLNSARKSGANSLVKPKNRLSKIKNIINSRNSRGKNKAQKFIIAANQAGRGGYVIGGANKILFRVTSIGKTSSIKTRRQSIKVEPLYVFRRKGTSKPRATHFMQRASLMSARELDNIYISEAQKQINRLK
jgi:hypothetical protein